MRIAIVGATGNTGTALLSELQRRPEVSSVVGVARRLPEVDAAPYNHAEWVTADIQFLESKQTLEDAFQGVDGVVHLAWLIQPNSKRELLRRVNVDGTRHVLEAAAAAGVKNVAVASSVGAYSPVEDDEPRREDWPTGGIPTSHYSVDKAAQEAVCDDFEQAHPEVNLARIRPALIFQADAGSEIQRYFAGRWAPVQILSMVRPPMVPMPQGVRSQAVHARDVAAAYAEAILRGARGAFNICADDILDGETIARVVARRQGGRAALSLPSQPIRPLIKAANRAHLLPMDEGWLDMATRVPIMDNTRAKEELGWKPTMTGAEALQELLEGMGSGEGRPSIPMRPRTADSPNKYPLPSRHHRADPDRIDLGLLRQYMADHLSGATAGLQRIRAMADDFIDTPVFPRLSEVAEAIRAEHDYLTKLMERQGFPRPGIQAPLLWAGERVSRLKPYGRSPLQRSPSALVLEAELMMGAVTAKKHGWVVLREHAAALGVPESVFDELIDAADHQREALEEVHTYARERAFRTDRETFVPGR
ncbi:NAD-dependent epimerase/dehydratase family protein [Nesterenkonia flava]|uniref:NAD-dependent epimerase/dehydratase family protein n=1 Tax=Nesterenkonia flava TaxID=469799 RepID=A0ABU1FRP0_9MICC|nr:NAD-dependent epimerase/dehydratase family protein [Nesterenkonia flava]MDR5711293.1 NAD-dependent epimerase/dehydratase family protein [Nesterenkonia flava]